MSDTTRVNGIRSHIVIDRWMNELTDGASRTSRDGRRHPPVLAVVAGDATEEQVRALMERLRVRGHAAAYHEIGSGVVALDACSAAALDLLTDHDAVVARIVVPDTRYRLARRDLVPGGSVVHVGGVPFGGSAFTVVAGPCAVEGREQIITTARAVAEAGGAALRGGAFKPRSSPYDFRGLGQHGVELLAEARAASGLPVITEVMDVAHIEPMYGQVDAFQVGARNMQNYDLLRALADVDTPVLLKRAAGATAEEWLLAAEYVLAGGNPRVILCERGIRTFNQHTRFTLDLATVAWAKQHTHLPVIVDPSHATGRPALVGPMARAALAAGADGVMIEVHPDPDAALSDGPQALLPADLTTLVTELRAIAPAVGRQLTLAPSPATPAGR